MLLWVKFLYQWLLPPGCFVLVLLWLWRYLRRHKAGVLASWGAYGALLLLYLSSITPVSGVLVHSLEQQYAPPPSAQGDVLIFLGGGAYAGVPDVDGRGQLSGAAANRLLTVARLQKKTNLPVLLSGGQVFEGSADEAVVAKRVLLALGVPEAQIYLDAQSRNTAENAKYSRLACEQHHWRRPLLVTSALHLPRALFFFQREGLQVTPYPADYLTNSKRQLFLLSFAPSADALAASSAALKEYLGLYAARLGAQ